MAKEPSFQFYPGDWRKDQNLSRASKKAKGVFMDILCLAFECEKRGTLKTAGKAWSIDEISYAVGGDINENREAIRELLELKVLKKDKKNAIFSKRMVHDEKIRRIRRVAGCKGGNPNLVNQKPNQKPTPSSSSSSSDSREHNLNHLVIYNAEKEILGNKIEFDRIASVSDKPLEQVKKSLRKYHLWLEEKEQYPKGRRAVFSGFEKWLMNEKKEMAVVPLEASNGMGTRYKNINDQ